MNKSSYHGTCIARWRPSCTCNRFPSSSCVCMVDVLMACSCSSEACFSAQPPNSFRTYIQAQYIKLKLCKEQLTSWARSGDLTVPYTYELFWKRPFTCKSVVWHLYCFWNSHCSVPTIWRLDLPPDEWSDSPADMAHGHSSATSAIRKNLPHKDSNLRFTEQQSDTPPTKLLEMRRTTNSLRPLGEALLSQGSTKKVSLRVWFLTRPWLAGPDSSSTMDIPSAESSAACLPSLQGLLYMKHQ